MHIYKLDNWTRMSTINCFGHSHKPPKMIVEYVQFIPRLIHSLLSYG